MEARITSFEFNCYKQLLRIPYTENKSNEEVKNCIELEVGKEKCCEAKCRCAPMTRWLRMCPTRPDNI